MSPLMCANYTNIILMKGGDTHDNRFIKKKEKERFKQKIY